MLISQVHIVIIIFCIARRIRYFKPVYKFRMHYLYSNLHYGIVSYLSELLGGREWEDLIQQHLYTPLGRWRLVVVAM